MPFYPENTNQPSETTTAAQYCDAVVSLLTAFSEDEEESFFITQALNFYYKEAELQNNQIAQYAQSLDSVISKVIFRKANECYRGISNDIDMLIFPRQGKDIVDIVNRNLQLLYIEKNQPRRLSEYTPQSTQTIEPLEEKATNPDEFFKNLKNMSIEEKINDFIPLEDPNEYREFIQFCYKHKNQFNQFFSKISSDLQAAEDKENWEYLQNANNLLQLLSQFDKDPQVILDHKELIPVLNAEQNVRFKAEIFNLIRNETVNEGFIHSFIEHLDLNEQKELFQLLHSKYGQNLPQSFKERYEILTLFSLLDEKPLKEAQIITFLNKQTDHNLYTTIYSLNDEQILSIAPLLVDDRAKNIDILLEDRQYDKLQRTVHNYQTQALTQQIVADITTSTEVQPNTNDTGRDKVDYYGRKLAILECGLKTMALLKKTNACLETLEETHSCCLQGSRSKSGEERRTIVELQKALLQCPVFLTSGKTLTEERYTRFTRVFNHHSKTLSCSGIEAVKMLFQKALSIISTFLFGVCTLSTPHCGYNKQREITIGFGQDAAKLTGKNSFFLPRPKSVKQLLTHSASFRFKE